VWHVAQSPVAPCGALSCDARPEVTFRDTPTIGLFAASLEDVVV
jgi:hypothetical protein